MKKNRYIVLLLAVAAWACDKDDYEIQSASEDIFQLWMPISYTPLVYESDSILWKTAEVIYVPFEQSGEDSDCSAIEFFRSGKLDYYNCGFCGSGPLPLKGTIEKIGWRSQNGEIIYRGLPQWKLGDYESRVVSATANKLRVIQERR